jgi:hypothetical protein
VKQLETTVDLLQEQLAMAQAALQAHPQGETVAAAAAAAAAAADAAVTKVVLVLLHETGLANPAIWEAWLQRLPPSVKVVFHLCSNSMPNARSDSNSADLQGLPGLSVLQDHLLPERFPAVWGETSMFTAAVKCMRIMLARCPSTEHVMLASGTHLPLSLQPFKGLQSGTSWVPRMLSTQPVFEGWAELGLVQLPELGPNKVRCCAGGSVQCDDDRPGNGGVRS